MTNQDYQSSMWTNGTYTVEWINQDEVKITRVFPNHSIKTCLIDGGDFERVLDGLLFSRDHQCTPINKE